MKPLSHLRILELAHMVSGPYAGMLLADLGAETIKIEPPGGEITRDLMTDDPRLNVSGLGPYFLSLNRNKKSVVLDLKSEQGLAAFYGLAAKSDVVITNYRVGVVQRLQIDHTSLSAVNSGIITCAITGFGETGPDRHLPSYDMIVQAMSGLMSVTGPPDGAPVRAGIPVSDVTSSMMAVIGILTALQVRERTGEGQHVDISMLDSQVSTMNYMAAISLMLGEAAPRIGSAHQNHVPYDVYPCQDGYIVIGVVTDAFWEALVQTLPVDDLNTEENRFRKGRLKNRAEIDRRLSDLFAAQDRAQLLKKLRKGGIPAAPVNDFLEAFSSPQIEARAMLIQTRQPDGSTVPMPGNPIKLSSTDETSFQPAPALGQHNLEVFSGLLGMTAAEIEELAVSPPE